MSEQTYQERERAYLIKLIEDANKEWYKIKRTVDGMVSPRYGDYIADVILAKGFSYKGRSEK